MAAAAAPSRGSKGVGVRVCAAATANADLCLGARSSGRTGVIIVDDGSDVPYKVQTCV